MNGYNKFIFHGTLANDPEKRITTSGQSLTKVTIALPNRVKQGNEWVDKADFHRLTIWGQPADFVAEFGKKGDQFACEGRIANNTWKDKDNVARYEVVFMVEKVISLISKNPKPAATRTQAAREDQGPPHEIFEAPTDDAPPEIDMP